MTRDDIQAVMDKLPMLENRGIRNSASPDFDKDRADLLGQADQCSLIENWVKDLVKTKTVNTNRTSYALKHMLAPSIGYSSNGAFIAAMIHCGFDYKRCSADSRNVCFNISQRSLKDLADRLKPQDRRPTLSKPDTTQRGIFRAN